MRIVDRTAFLALPAGTIYAQAYEPWAWRDLHVKGDSLLNDWTCLPLNSPESLDDGFPGQAMLDLGVSVGLDVENWGRDGLFRSDAIFLIYERDDLVKLRAIVDEAIEAVEDPRDA